MGSYRRRQAGDGQDLFVVEHSLVGLLGRNGDATFHSMFVAADLLSLGALMDRDDRVPSRVNDVAVGFNLPAHDDLALTPRRFD